ncbi:MAG: hypothetical protein Q8N44_07295 [Rubrivivax sp.]|nr:hypothetical protein [Rubrivivax sp.]
MFSSSTPVTTQRLVDQAAPLLDRASQQASALAQRGVDALHDGSQHLRQASLRARDSTLDYIKDEPVKSVLIAAAAGAALVALIGLFGRRPTRG